jgi:Skp family chaperone for outer membrane proteins
MRSISSLLLTTIMVLILTGCAAPISAVVDTATPTEDIAATQAFERDQIATVLSERRTSEALQMTNEALQKTVDAKAALAQTETVQAMQAQETLEAKATRAEELAATRTAKTATAKAEKTEQVRPIYERVQQLYEDNAISTKNGKYHRVDDFNQSWAQINWYQWWRTGLKLENFVVRVDAEWESASKIANWFASGCGFVYSENGTYDHFASFLALDGNVYNHRVRSGVSSNPAGGYYGTVGTPNGSAELMMVVDQTIVSFYVNGKRVSRFSDSTISKGDFALTLNSGTNLDYGTRCKMSNIDVWELK